MEKPVVLVTSYAEHITTAEEIINNILEVTNSTNKESSKFTVAGDTSGIQLKKYVCNLRTKYYNIEVDLVSCCNEITQLPDGLLSQVEAVIVYFDAHQPSFLQSPARELINLLEEKNIELGLLLTNQLCDDASQGITYGNAKTATKLLFDVIEIGTRETIEENDITVIDNGYHEVFEALRNHLWSSVQYPENPLESKVSSTKANTTENNSEDSEGVGNLEEQLESFEHLLRSIQNFKNLTANMDREEMLDHAEKLAELFSDLFVEDS